MQMCTTNEESSSRISRGPFTLRLRQRATLERYSPTSQPQLSRKTLLPRSRRRDQFSAQSLGLRPRKRKRLSQFLRLKASLTTSHSLVEQLRHFRVNCKAALRLKSSRMLTSNQSTSLFTWVRFHRPSNLSFFLDLVTFQ